MKKLIRVTAKDIEAGKRDNCVECPVALAMTRTLAKKVSVMGFFWRFCWEGLGAHPLPLCVAKFVSDFDNGNAVAPFTFTVDL